MLLLKFFQSLIKALNSEGTPGQVAAGFALGAALGLTPLLSLHNLAVVTAAFLLNVSIPGVMLGWLTMTPVGFLLDGLFDSLGSWLLVDVPALMPLWVALYNAPVAAWTGFNNTVVLGSLVSWIAAGPLLFLGGRWAVLRYRETLYQRLVQTRVFKAARASRLYNLYRLLRP